MREKGQSLCRSIRKCRRSQKSQSLRDRQRNHLKNARDCEEEKQMLNKEMEERKALYETRFRALSEKSGHCRKAAAELENQIQTLQVGEERRGCSASQSNGCCFDPATGEQVFAFWRNTSSKFYPIYPARVRQAVQNSRPERDWDDEEQSGWYESAAVDPVVDSDRCQDANGGTEKWNACWTAPVHRMGNMAKWRRMESFDKGGEHWQEKGKTSRGRTQRPFKETATEGTPVP